MIIYVLGLDYMGKWASFGLYLGMQPESVPITLQPDNTNAIAAIVGGIVLGLFGFLILGQGSGLGILMLFIGIVISGIGRYLNSQIKNAAKREQNQQFSELFARQMSRLSRTFKIEDARLFCMAMNVVFQAVVDDIVKRGGKVVRVEGGQGGFFSNKNDSKTGNQISERRSDAAQTDV